MDFLRTFLQSAFSQLGNITKSISRVCLTQRKAQAVVVVGVTLIVGLIGLSLATSLARQKNMWSETGLVLVATTDIDAHTALSGNNTRMVSLPYAIVPDDVIVHAPNSEQLRVSVRAHTVLTQSLLVSSGESLSIPDGWRIVALPNALARPPMAVGEVIDVVGGSTVIAEAARIASLDPFTIAVPVEVSAAVAAAARLGEISIIMRQ